MSVTDLLEHLRTLDIRIRVKGGRLQVDAPKDALQPSLKEAIKAHRDELLEMLGDDPLGAYPLVRQPRRAGDNIFPLSISQHAFFMLDRINPGSRAFNIFSVRELDGELDIDHLSHALARVVAQYDLLRTSLELDAGQARQRVHPSVDAALQVIDLSGLEVARREQLGQYYSDRAQAPRFVLERAPLFNLKVIRHSSRRHVLVLAMHHIIADDRTVELFYRELIREYASQPNSANASPAANPQYGDYAHWERQLLDDGVLEPSIVFWKQQLRDMPTLLAGEDDEALAESSCATLHLCLGEQRTSRLESLAAAAGVSEFVWLLSAYQIAWCLYSGLTDIPVIVPASGRNLPETRAMPGLFVNGIVMRTELNNSERVSELFANNARISQAALEHRLVSLEALDGILRLRGERDIHLDRLSRVGFNYLAGGESRQALQLDGLSITSREVERTESVFSVLTIAERHAGRLRIKTEYQQSLWTQAQAQAFAALFESVIEQLCDPDKKSLNQLAEAIKFMPGATGGSSPDHESQSPVYLQQTLTKDSSAGLRACAEQAGQTLPLLLGGLTVMALNMAQAVKDERIIRLDHGNDQREDEVYFCPIPLADESVSDWLARIHPAELDVFGRVRSQQHSQACQVNVHSGSHSGEHSAQSRRVKDGCVHLYLEGDQENLRLSGSVEQPVRHSGLLLQRIEAVAARLDAGNATAAALDFFSPGDAAVMEDLNTQAEHAGITDKSALELFAEQVDAQAEQTAIRCEGQQLSFTELDALSDTYARWISEQTGGEVVTVGVCLQRAAALPAVLLGIWKAGCAFVPVDPEYPAARIAVMMNESNAGLLLINTEIQIDQLDIPVLELPVLSSVDNSTGITAPQPEPGKLAYIMFTSGSSGQPKGVMITHGALSNLLQSMRHRPGMSSEDTLLAITSLSFDIALLEILLPLISGGCLQIASVTAATDPGRIIDGLNDQRVTLCQATPSTWRLLLKCGWQARAGLRIWSGGEALDAALADRLLSQGDALWNLYGPTETTIWSCLQQVEDSGLANSIGRPVANTTVQVLDADGRQLPAGVPGELVIGGTGLALGYCGEAGVQQQAFIETGDGDATVRAYRTGDRVYVDDGGRLRFIGRTDRQIKWRGVRIELDEIEAVLNAMPGVGENAVWLQQVDGSAGLIACAVTPAASAVEKITAGSVKAILTRHLPASMLPERIVITEQLPRLASGKLDRKRLPALVQGRPSASAGDQLESRIAAVWSDVLGHADFSETDNFFDVGGHSMLLLNAHQRLTEVLDSELQPIDLFTHTSINALADWLRSRGVAHADPGGQPLIEATGGSRPRQEETAIAVIGMAGRFPQAADMAEFWDNLCAGRESIQTLDEQTLSEQGVPAALLTDERYVRRASVIDNADAFDAGFFGLSAREAELLDPQHRLLLEWCYLCLEDAGYDYRRLSQRVGLFAGTGISSYLIYNLWPNRSEILRGISPLELLYANDKDYAVTRTSYQLNLRGPSVSLGTACSTGLVAVHQACTSLLHGECEMALAAAVKLAVPQQVGYIHQPGGILSADGHCRPFDAEAGGTVFGSGGCSILLKPLSAAEKDGDDIYAVIRGSAINNDGHEKLGFTAPSVNGQAAVIRAAMQQAGINAGEVGYIEAHGTGTQLGDPVEVAALNQIFQAVPTAPSGQPCRLGSVKANIGHLDTAAGIAGLAKVVLSLRHGCIPPSINFERLNERIDWNAERFQINTATEDWPAPPGQRMAGVSSFGIGGSNAHVIVQDYQRPSNDNQRPDTLDKPRLCVLSAETPAALEARVSDLAAWLAEHRQTVLDDVAYTLQTGRPEMRHRLAVAADSIEGLRKQLEQPPETSSAVTAVSGRRLIWLFPGQGLELSANAAGLYHAWPVYRQAFDDCCEQVTRASGPDLRRLLLEPDQQPSDQLMQTRILQPALFAAQYSLAQLLQQFGLHPSVMLGHSLGEITAACLAGVFELETAVRLVVMRGEQMQAAPDGAMLAVFAPAEELAGHMPGAIRIAGYNAATVTVVSGPPQQVADFAQQCQARDVQTRSLPVDRAFHTPDMQAAADRISEFLHTARLQPPGAGLLSTLQGDWADERMASGDYWRRQALEPVRFYQCLNALQLSADDTVIELDLNSALTRLLLAHPDAQPELAAPAVPAKNSAADEDAGTAARIGLLNMVAHAWQRGWPIDWGALDEYSGRRRVHLPLYRFARERYWVDRPDELNTAAGTAGKTKRNTSDKWLYESAWLPGLQPLPGPSPETIRSFYWVVLLSDKEYPVEQALIKQLQAHDGDCLVLKKSPAEATDLKNDVLVVDADEPDDLQLICAGLASSARLPVRVVYGWGLDLDDSTSGQHLSAGLAQLARVAAGFGADAENISRLTLITHQAQSLLPDELPCAAQAMLSGAVRVLAHESPGLECGQLDVDTAFLQGRRAAMQCLLADGQAANGLPLSIRSGQYWRTAFSRSQIQIETAKTPSGVCVITGGLGGIGALLAEHLIGRGCRVALLGRTPLNKLPESGTKHQRHQHLLALQPELAYYAVDVSDSEAVAQVFESINGNFSTISMIIHAAGCADGRMAELHTPATIHSVMQPKMPGTRALWQAAQQYDVARMILFSSLSAVSGDAGQLAYAAANSGLAALAAQINATGISCICIDWDTWRDVGMAAESSATGIAAQALAQRRERGLSNVDGLAVFDRLMTQPAGRVTVSTTDIEDRLDEWRGLVDEPAPPAARYYPRPNLDDQPQPPGNDTEAKLVLLWCEALRLESVGVTDNYFDLGGTSLQALQLVAAIAAETGIKMPTSVLLERANIRALAGYIEDRRGPGASDADQPLLVPLSAGQNDDLPVLYLVHPIGGQVYVYRELAQQLAGRVRIIGIRTGTDEPPSSDVSELAAVYLRQIQDHDNPPCYLGGSSFGGMIAYEMAQQLAAAGRPPRLLVMLDTPDATDVADRYANDHQLLLYLARQMPEFAWLRATVEQSQPAAVKQLLRQLDAGQKEPGAVSGGAGELIRHLHRLQSHMRAMQAYRAAPYTQPVLYVKARQRRPEVDPLEPETAWQARCAQFELAVADGDHVSLHQPPFVQAVAECIGDKMQYDHPRPADACHESAQ